MSLRFVDVNGLGGGMLCGMVQNGMELVHRTGDLTLGAANIEANRHIVGWNWTSKFGPDPSDWRLFDDIDVVSGSPPCAGFSTLSSKEFRGSNSKANVHMHRLVAYAGRVAPTVATFESVQQAFSQGGDLMTELRDKLEAETGHKYSLYHVLHNNASVGGAAQRPRYFWLVSRVPFGVEYPVPDVVPTLMDSIGDLRGLSSTWEKQPYRYPDTWWSSRRRDPDGVVDGHAGRNLTYSRRIAEIFDALDGDWPAGKDVAYQIRRIYEKYGKLTPAWKSQESRIVARNFDMGFNEAVRWPADRAAYVLTGGALSQAIHPTEPRLFTHREAFRIQGFPDGWRLWPLRDVRSTHRTAGKGVPVDASRWLGHWISESIAGRPGSVRGVPHQDREFIMRVDRGYKDALRRGMRRSEVERRGMLLLN